MLKRASTPNKFSKVESLSSNEKMLRGTAWLSTGLLVSRMIGALYIIPWSIWVGEHFGVANSLFALAYVPYVLCLDLATAGFPMAITKQISQLNSQNEYRASVQLFKNSFIIMSLLGFIMALLFYALAYQMVGTSFPTGNIEDNVVVLRSLAPAILILPSISLLRGFFQGFQQMTTPAISQIIEQVVRVLYMLFATFYIMTFGNGSIVDAVTQSTLATFFGALSSGLFLCYELYKERHYIFEKIKFSANRMRFSFTNSLKVVLKDSLPFIIVSSGTSLLAVIDIYFYSPVVRDFSSMSETEIAVSIGWFSANAPKLIGIVGSLSIAVTSATIPTVSALYFKKNMAELSNTISQNIALMTFLVLPSAVGMIIVSESIYQVFYPTAAGAHVLPAYCIVLISVGIMSLFISMIQGMGKHAIAFKALTILLLSKIACVILFTALFQENGPGLSLLVSSALTFYYLWHVIDHIAHINKKLVYKRLIAIFICVGLMAIVAFVVHYILNIMLPPDGKLVNFVRVFITAVFGGLSYIIATLYFRVADQIMPEQANKLRRILRMTH